MAFIDWLLPRLKTYLKDADKIVDLTYYKFTLNGVEKTQREVIVRMIELCEIINSDRYWFNIEEHQKCVNELLDW